jgi:hypothetical protein
MDALDQWAEQIPVWSEPPLELHPTPGASRLGHNRIISWCGFFNTVFTVKCAKLANGRMPVPSQDGYMWYCAKRLGLPIVRVNLKGSTGWEHWSNMDNVRKAAERALGKT